ncbi:hypothetical protein CP533_6538 [Ophiocordyceps camponoti-saundersi (nom. inval.)]|nr:hypothetical protein CP533_6538 [Ophiocordyceps camponoti-saundersi (nom. inval.)]
MDSRPAKGAGSKKLMTYGALSRSKTPAPPATRQSNPTPHFTVPKLAESNKIYKYRSFEFAGTDTSKTPPGLVRHSTEISANEHGIRKKRKQSVSATLDERPNCGLGGLLKRESESVAITSPNFGTCSSSGERKHQMDTRRAFAANQLLVESSGLKDDGKLSTPRRRRLIDALATPDGLSTNEATDTVLNGNLEASELEEESNLTQRVQAIPESRSGAGNRRSTPYGRKIRLTYSQSGSSFGKSQALEGSSPLAIGSIDDSILPNTHAPSSPVGDEDTYNYVLDDPHPQPAIRSVHELRRSGAFNRYADEIDDLLIRIGKPGTGTLATRRTALCELAQRLALDSFAEQFRDHGCRDKIAVGVGEEDDVICGFALAAALIIFFKSNSAPHLVRELTRQGLGKFLGQLLRVEDDIDIFTARKHAKLSRTLLASLYEVKRTMMDTSIWHGYKPIILSPRTLSLRLLETVSRCSEGQLLQQVADDLGRDLTTVASVLKTSEVLDYALTVYALEMLSGAGVSIASDKAGFSEFQLPKSIFSFLRRAMAKWPSERHDLGSAVIKLAINTTNTEDGAAAFDVADLSLLADRIERGFATVKQAISYGALENGIYDELLLILGVMINVVEHSHRARTSLEGTALDKIAKLWEDNQPAVSEVSISQ